jgi:hypothetical protein
MYGNQRKNIMVTDGCNRWDCKDKRFLYFTKMCLFLRKMVKYGKIKKWS